MALTQQQAEQMFGTDVCKWPSFLQGPLFQLEPGIAAACAAGHVVNSGDVSKFAKEAVGGSVGATPGFTNPLTGLNAIGDLAQRLTQPHTWVRVGEAIAGGLLLFIALQALTRGTAVGEVTGKTARIAKKVA